ncbi:MAG: RES family NAD+ phosphorylase [Vulcanimicrobiaceae bacterium]
MAELVLVAEPTWRIIPSRYPEVDLWDRIGRPADIDDFLAIEALTNDRIREARGAIARVRSEDRISGPGTTPIMAAFAYGHAGRFNDETFGAYYAAFSEAAAIAESRFARERFLRATNEPSIDLDMRVYTTRVSGRYDDVRKRAKSHAIYDPASYDAAQSYGRAVWAADKHDGVAYRSVRRWSDGACVAVFRPRCIATARATKHLRYAWDGVTIANVYEIKLIAP